MNLNRSPKTDCHLSLLRWNLSPPAAALWQLATQRICQELVIRASWIEIESNWSPTVTFESSKLTDFQESIIGCRASAFVVGIDRSTLGYMSSIARHLRKICNQRQLDKFADSETSTSPTFLIAWFPQADRESMQILRELGFDLVVHKPSSLHSLLLKIAQCDY